MMTPSVMPALLYYEDIVPLIPAMTDYSSPSGVASCSSEIAGTYNYYAWQAFAGAPGLAYPAWDSNQTTTPEWIQYAFPYKKRVCQMSFDTAAANVYDFTLLLQCSNDDSFVNWTT